MSKLSLALLFLLPVMISAYINTVALYPGGGEYNLSYTAEDTLLVTREYSNGNNNAIIKIYNAANPANLQLLSTVISDTSYIQTNIQLHNTKLFISTSNCMKCISLVNPVNPVLLYTITDYWSERQSMIMTGNCIYISTINHGLRIYDMINGTLTGVFEQDTCYYRMWGEGNRLSGLVIDNPTSHIDLIDVTISTTPVITCALPFDFEYDVAHAFYYQNYLYLNDYTRTSTIYDVSNMNSPQIAGYLSLRFKTPPIVRNNLLFFIYNGNLEVRDLSVISLPLAVSYPVYTGEFPTLVLSSSFAYIRSGFYDCPDNFLDISQINEPSIATEFEYNTGFSDSHLLGLKDNHLFGNGFVAAMNEAGNITDCVAHPELECYYDFDFEIKDNLLCKSAGNDCKIYSIEEPDAPILLSSITLADISHLEIYGTTLFLQYPNSLHYYNVSNPSQPVSIGTLEIFLTDAYAYYNNYFLAVHEHNLLVYQTEEAGFILVGTFPLNDTSVLYPDYGMAIYQQYLYLTFDNRIRVYDLSNLLNVTMLNEIQIPMLLDRTIENPIIYNNRYLVVTTDIACKILYYDLQNPEQPELININSLPFRIKRSVVYNNHLMVVNNGVIYCLQMPQLTGNADPVMSHVNAICVYPNPFRQNTTISFFNKDIQPVKMTIFNLKGQVVNRLKVKSKKAGLQYIHLKAEYENRRILPSGTYFLRLEVEDNIYTTKIVLLK